MPNSTPALPVSTVFISSRMEEVAIERRAAFNATYESGLVPLLFETEPGPADLKASLDHLVDRAHLFVGVYYRTFGKRYEDELFGMTPIEYEFFRFLEVWKARYKYDSALKDPGGWEFGGAESGAADEALERLKDPETRHRHLYDLWRVSGIGDDNWKKFKKGREFAKRRELRLYRHVLRTRVVIFTRGDGEASTISTDLAEFLPPRPHHCHERFQAQPVGQRPREDTTAPDAERYTEPHVELYRGLKKRWKDAVDNEILKDPRRESTARTNADLRENGATLETRTADREGLLEEILEVLFAESLNVSLLALDMEKGGVTQTVLTVLPSRTPEPIDDRRLRDIRVNLHRRVEVFLSQASERGPNLPPLGKVKIKRVLDTATRMGEAWSLIGYRTPFQELASARESDFYRLRMSGADVPGMFLSIARVIADSGANIVQIAFSSNEEDRERRARHIYNSFTYFDGDVVVRWQDGGGDVGLENRLLELRYKLINLLGVQTIDIQPVEAGDRERFPPEDS